MLWLRTQLLIILDLIERKKILIFTLIKFLLYQKLFEELKHSSLLIFPNFRAYSTVPVPCSTVPVPCSTVPVPCITVPVPCSTVQPRFSRLQWPTQVRFHDHETIPPADQSEAYLYPLTNQSPTIDDL